MAYQYFFYAKNLVIHVQCVSISEAHLFPVLHLIIMLPFASVICSPFLIQYGADSARYHTSQTGFQSMFANICKYFHFAQSNISTLLTVVPVFFRQSFVVDLLNTYHTISLFVKDFNQQTCNA